MRTLELTCGLTISTASPFDRVMAVDLLSPHISLNDMQALRLEP